LIAACRLPMEWKLPRRIRWRVGTEKNVSTAFSQEPECRREVVGPARMPREPGLHLWMPMGGVVVDDSLNNPAGWHRALDGIGKADELLMADTGLAASGRDMRGSRHTLLNLGRYLTYPLLPFTERLPRGVT
jgi:hypothetical protein